MVGAPKPPAPVAKLTRRRSEAEILACIRIVSGDITKLKVDAIVCPAMAASPVERAIYAAAGPGLQKDSRTLRRLINDRSVMHTQSYQLAAHGIRAILHTQGPAWTGATGEDLGRSAQCYLDTVNLANDMGFATLAFPCFSSGDPKVPVDVAARLALAATAMALEQCPDVTQVVFCCGTAKDLEAYRALHQAASKAGTLGDILPALADLGFPPPTDPSSRQW